MMLTEPVAKRLGRFSVDLRLDTVPEDATRRAKDLLLDHIGVSMLGTQSDWCKQVRTFTVRDNTASESVMYGAQRVGVRAAAFANGTAAHSFELDDTHEESVNHPGCVVIPAALAVAEKFRRSGADFLLAMVTGYDVQCRIGAAFGNAIIRNGFHPTATCGAFGSAAAAATLMGLSTQSVIDALGLAASMSSGLMEFAADPERNVVKRIHGGMPAERGIFAAQLAAEGISAPGSSLDGENGFARVFADSSNFDRVLDGLGERFEISAVSVKRYACCKQFHSLIEAIGECRKHRPFDASDIDFIQVFGTNAMIEGHMEYTPRSPMAAQYSLPYTAAVAVMLDPGSPQSFTDKHYLNQDVLALTNKVRAEWDERLEGMYPTSFPAGVRIRLRAGEDLFGEVIDSSSSARRPMASEQIENKFRSMTEGILNVAVQDAIVDAVSSFECAGSVESLTSLLVSDPTMTKT
ncbi:MmgE/PrpD family protein [Caballeronia calidae]|uniref:MmgE/PrpD family protein n=1 Tax=Caballeronia calidae TaxID=1777139 RepID=A0A158E4A3_9BURK|nr:MmgE/PrpD family protein [Caballeronia calidae]SAL01692.1 MmgE/PrpD family protein [Caballeronia calidae]